MAVRTLSEQRRIAEHIKSKKTAASSLNYSDVMPALKQDIEKKRKQRQKLTPAQQRALDKKYPGRIITSID